MLPDSPTGSSDSEVCPDHQDRFATDFNSTNKDTGGASSVQQTPYEQFLRKTPRNSRKKSVKE